jgi:hypothetical protein
MDTQPPQIRWVFVVTLALGAVAASGAAVGATNPESRWVAVLWGAAAFFALCAVGVLLHDIRKRRAHGSSNDRLIRKAFRKAKKRPRLKRFPRDPALTYGGNAVHRFGWTEEGNLKSIFGLSQIGDGWPGVRLDVKDRDGQLLTSRGATGTFYAGADAFAMVVPAVGPVPAASLFFADWVADLGEAYYPEVIATLVVGTPDLSIQWTATCEPSNESLVTLTLTGPETDATLQARVQWFAMEPQLGGGLSPFSIMTHQAEWLVIGDQRSLEFPRDLNGEKIPRPGWYEVTWSADGKIVAGHGFKLLEDMSAECGDPWPDDQRSGRRNGA